MKLPFLRKKKRAKETTSEPAQVKQSTPEEPDKLSKDLCRTLINLRPTLSNLCMAIRGVFGDDEIPSDVQIMISKVCDRWPQVNYWIDHKKEVDPEEVEAGILIWLAEDAETVKQYPALADFFASFERACKQALTKGLPATEPVPVEA